MKKMYTRILQCICLCTLFGSICIQTAIATSNDKKIIAYYTDWSVYDRAYFVADIPASKITHINFSFLYPFVSATPVNVWDAMYVSASGSNLNVVAVAQATTGEYVGLALDGWGDIQKSDFTRKVGDGDMGNYCNNLTEWVANGKKRGVLGELIKLKQANPHIKTIASLGGWTWSGTFYQIAASTATREAMAKACKDFVQTCEFDGIDIDWEYPVSGGNSIGHDPHDDVNYVQLLKAIRTQLNTLSATTGATYYLTIAAGASPDDFKTQLVTPKENPTENICTYLDWINLMTYDFNGPWSSKTGHNAPCYLDPNAANPTWNSATAIEAYLAEDVPKEKLTMSIPFYGRGFANAASTNNGLFQTFSGVGTLGSWEAGNFEFKDLKYGSRGHQYINANGYTRYWDATAKVPYLYNPSTQLFISYDDEESLTEKVNYAVTNDLAGVMFWELSCDTTDYLLATTLYNTLMASREVRITGHVTNDAGAALSGCTVSLYDSTSVSTTTATTDTNGYYTFLNLTYAHTYTVTFAKTNYFFTPERAVYSTLTVDKVLDVSASLTTYTISGTVKDGTATGIAGSTVTLKSSDVIVSSVVTTASGAYSFAQLPKGGTYVVTPTKRYYTCTPSSATITNIAADTTQNFTAAIATYAITGTITCNSVARQGITVSLSGSSTTSTTTNASGVYTFSNLFAGGNYTVAPSSGVTVFTPTSRTYDAITENITSADFSFTEVLSVTGYVLDGTSGIANITVAIQGTANVPSGWWWKTVTTNAQGYYEFLNVPQGMSFTLSLSTQDTYIPTQKTFESFSQSATQNFTKGTTLSLTGYVKNTSGFAIQSTSVTITGTGISVSSMVLTDADGKYTFTGLQSAGNYVVTPAKTNYTFVPTSHTVTNLTVSTTLSDFVGTSSAQTFFIKGCIKDARNNAMQNVTVSLSGGISTSTVTDASGNFELLNVVGGENYTVTAGKTGYVFTPSERQYTPLVVNKENQNFTGSVYVAPPKKVIAYYANWDTREVGDIPASKLTHINYAFADVTSDFLCAMNNPTVDTAEFTKLRQLKTMYPHLKTLISIGGADPTMEARFRQLSANATYRVKFATSCVKFVVDNGFDGVDIDWEFPVTADDKINTTLLMKEVRDQFNAQSALDGKTYLLTGAISFAKERADVLEISRLNDYMDWVNIMTYDVYMSWVGFTGHNAPLYKNPNEPQWWGNQWGSFYNADESVRYYIAQGMPASKIVIGAGFYGRLYKNIAQGTNYGLFQTCDRSVPNDTPLYSAIQDDYINKNGFERHWDDASQCPWLYSPSVDGGTLISYDDVESVTAKSNYAKDNSLGGMMFWHLGGDDSLYTLVNTIYNQLNELVVYYSISGYVRDSSGTAIVNSTVTLQMVGGGKTSYWTTSNGYYLFEGVAGGLDYTLTVQKSSYTFSPSTRTVTSLSQNMTGQNFVGTLGQTQTFYIKGYVKNSSDVGISGATVTLSMDGIAVQTYCTTSTTNGYYEFIALEASKRYDVTVQKSSYTFSPSTRTVTSLSQDTSDQNFIGTSTAPVLYYIRGTVSTSTTTLSGVTITLQTSGVADRTYTTSSNGTFEFLGLSSGTTCLLLPEKSGYSFSPSSRVMSGIAQNWDSQNFTATRGEDTVRYFIKGQVLNSVNAAGIAYATITLAMNGTTIATYYTGDDGLYEFLGLTGSVNYVVSITQPQYAFTQSSHTITTCSQNYAGKSFVGVLLCTIQGYVRDVSGNGIAGSTVTLSGSTDAVYVSTSSGYFAFSNVASNGNYTITPAHQLYTFAPTSKSYVTVTGDVTQNFTGTFATHTISGYVRDAASVGITGSTITLSGTTNAVYVSTSSGYFVFANLVSSGSYTITPTHQLYALDPTSKSYNTLTGDVTQDFTGTFATHTISGYVRDKNGVAISSVTVRLYVAGTASGSAASMNRTSVNTSHLAQTQTSTAGNYIFSNLHGEQEYEIELSKPGYRFSPARKRVSFSNADILCNFDVVYSIAATDIRNVIMYPNPCYMYRSGYLRIGNIPSDATNVRVYFYDITGVLVKTLNEDTDYTNGDGMRIGMWNGKDDNGDKVASGVYVGLVKCDGKQKKEKVAIMW